MVWRVDLSGNGDRIAHQTYDTISTVIKRLSEISLISGKVVLSPKKFDVVVEVLITSSSMRQRVVWVHGFGL
jgi:hypothetical protein